jgi:hypothetical protein
MAGPIYFAIGDVHGEADKLRQLIMPPASIALRSRGVRRRSSIL